MKTLKSDSKKADFKIKKWQMWWQDAGVCYVGELWQGGMSLSRWLPRPTPPRPSGSRGLQRTQHTQH